MNQMDEKLKAIIEEAQEIRRRAIRLYDSLRDFLVTFVNELKAEEREELTFKTLPTIDSMIINASSIVVAVKNVVEDLKKIS
jgi:3-methyladenine DNA glycosylase Tag